MQGKIPELLSKYNKNPSRGLKMVAAQRFELRTLRV